MLVLFRPHLICPSSQHSMDRLQPHSFLQLFVLVPCCPSAPTDHPGLPQKHILCVLWANSSHVHRHPPFKQQGLPLWPADAEITSFAHDGSCWSSHLSPCLCLKDLLHPRLLLLFFHFLTHTPSAQESATMVESSTSTPKSFTTMNTDNETNSFLPAAAAAICLLNFSVSVSEMPTACPLHTLARTKPILSNFLTPVLMCNLSGNPIFPDERKPHIALFLSSSPSPSPLTALFSFSARSTPSVSTLVVNTTLLFSSYIPKPSLPSCCMMQSPCFSSIFHPSIIDSCRPFSSKSLSVHFKTCSAIPTSSLFLSHMNAVISSRIAVRVRRGSAAHPSD